LRSTPGKATTEGVVGGKLVQAVKITAMVTSAKRRPHVFKSPPDRWQRSLFFS
jgi:hypothetical protein